MVLLSNPFVSGTNIDCFSKIGHLFAPLVKGKSQINHGIFSVLIHIQFSTHIGYIVGMANRKPEPLKKLPEAKKAPASNEQTGPKRKFDAKSYARNGLTQDEVIEIKNAFDLFDTDSSGSVDIKEIKAAMTSLGFQTKNGIIFQMIADLDEDGNGSLEFPEWLHLMTNRVSDKDSRASYKKIFMLFDDERTGYITVKNLRRVCQQIDENIGEEEMVEMIRRAGLDNPDQVTEEEFYQIMTRKPKASN